MVRRGRPQFPLVAAALLLLGAWLRFHALAQACRLHPDEALFSTFARAAAVQGAWLLPGPLDKPPLSLYAVALSMLPFTTGSPQTLIDLDLYLGEFAARLPGVFGSILLLALAYALAQRLYRARSTALAALALLALSPFAVAFSATAFTDSLMLPLLLAALLAVVSGRWALAGLALGLAFAAKQQALLYLPLVLGLGALATTGSAQVEAGGWAGRLARLALPILIVMGLLLLWDAARGQTAGFWALAAANNDPWRLLRAGEVWPRLGAWLGHGGVFFGTPWVTAGVVLLALTALFWRVIRRPRRRETAVDLVLLTYTLAYLLLHWLVAFNTYDRYLLPVLPVAALLAARGLATILGPPVPSPRASSAPFHRLRNATLIVALVALLLPPALESAAGRGSVGGDRGEHTGIDALAAWVNGYPPGTILYDPWLGWELGYYLGAWTDKRRVYYPTPRLLAEGAAAQPDPAPRLFVAPEDAAVSRWLEALEAGGYTAELVYREGRFVGYELRRTSAQ